MLSGDTIWLYDLQQVTQPLLQEPWDQVCEVSARWMW